MKTVVSEIFNIINVIFPDTVECDTVKAQSEQDKRRLKMEECKRYVYFVSWVGVVHDKCWNCETEGWLGQLQATASFKE